MRSVRLRAYAVSSLPPILALLAFFALIVARAEGGDPTSDGKPATIVSDSATITGTKAPDVIVAGPGDNTIYGEGGNDTICAGAGDDTIYGGPGNDVLYGVDIEHPRKDSGAAIMKGGPGSDLMVGGQPCDGDLFDGGPGTDDSASFARVHNSAPIAVEATIGGAVTTPGVPHCTPGHITTSTEKIEGSPGNDVLTGDNGPNTLLGRGGNDKLNGMGGFDVCIGGAGHDTAVNCEKTADIP